MSHQNVLYLCLATIPRIHTLDRYNEYMSRIDIPYTYYVQISGTNILYTYIVPIPRIYTSVQYVGNIHWYHITL